ncbi:MAG: glutamate dehydrogenase [Deltaproteobacteria bacterium]|nr:glutamate dehydrogenase [Deltaproteobacteria bacterium]
MSAEVRSWREVFEALRDKITPAEQPLVAAFTRELFDKDGAAALAERDGGRNAAMTLAAFRFLAQPSTGEPRVRVVEPEASSPGGALRRSVVETTMRDRPFIVDTVQETLRRAGCLTRRLVHPVLAVDRDARGGVVAIRPADTRGHNESFVHVEVEGMRDAHHLLSLLQERLDAVVRATDDYAAMRARAAALAEELRGRPLPAPWNVNADEIASFLQWLGEKNFVFLGYREYDFAGEASERTAAVRSGSGLGILRSEDHSAYARPRPLPEVLQRRLNEPPLLLISKTNAESPIHRAGHMDYIGVKAVDRHGTVVAERRFLGLFTSKAYAEEPARVPILRRTLSEILAAEGALEESYTYKSIVTVFDSIPKLELLAASIPELRTEIARILAAQSPGDVALICRPDALERGVFIVVLLPRERFSGELQRRIEACLTQALAATVLEQHVVLDERDQVRLHYYLTASPETLRTLAPEDLRLRLAALMRTWDDRLCDLLAAAFPPERARQLADRYVPAFSHAYKADTDVADALADIRCIEAVATTHGPQIDLVNDRGNQRFTALKLYLADTELVLSDFLPVLENLGLRVFAEDFVTVPLADVGRIRIHTFLVQDATGARLDVACDAPLLAPALLMLQTGQLANDPLNGLIMAAALPWRSVDLLRTYVHHGVQIGTAPTRGALTRALLSAPPSARLLWEYFEAKFDPRHPGTPDERSHRLLPEIEQRFLSSLDAVQSVADDRVLRALFTAVAATVRTNFFRPECGPAIAIKLACERIPHMPRPHPLFEVYVHAPHVEALHLRGAKVARGGIRLSDRADDFRTEILDLLKTQLVKNAVIVPAGAKGGFVPTTVPSTAGGVDQIVAAYRTFINALLDVTDNIIEGRVVSPPQTVLYDDPDPYLVVAADKGTATFSDIANAVAAAHQFWLADAFASGGTHGYDHKKEGITARGAWACVRRHFREMGRDAEREDITVIGIGDMSGDVFGNGLLLSRRLRLRAAFNHAHVFLDPDPDPPRSFVERERLFRLPRSGWVDYDARLISDGGGVFPRAAKAIPLSAPVRAMLGIDAAAATGEEVVRAILRMDADLLWNGGIGTYVKASTETHAAVGDSANDAVRVDGAELRVRVVAEGGNLGFTQRGRVEYALNGGRINTDAIDNSAGVDMSDHEVNLKIALAAAVEDRQLAVTDRNQLLQELTPEVARRVLSHNGRQARILGLDQLASQTHIDSFRELMNQLESEGVLDRQLEALPDREALRNRRGLFLGLTRPELATVMGYTKLWLQRHVLASRLPDDAFFEIYLHGYFPEVIDRRFARSIRGHRLRREIIAVELANALIDTMGAVFVSRVASDTGAAPVSIVRAWALAVAATGASEHWAEIANCTPALPLPAETRCWLTLQNAIERATKWMLATPMPDRTAEQRSGALRAATAELLALLPRVLPTALRTEWAATIAELTKAGAPSPLAERVVSLDRAGELFEIQHIADDRRSTPARVAAVYYQLGDLIDLDWIRHSLAALPAADRWERRALEGLSEGLGYARRYLTRAVLRLDTADAAVERCVQRYTEQHREQLERLRALISDIKSASRTTLAALLVVMRELGRLAGHREE